MESIDPRTRFLYTPHTVTFLLLGAPLPAPLPAASAAAGQLGGALLARHPPSTPCYMLPAGLAALIYVAHPFHPEPRPADAEAAAAVGYLNAKTGIWAIILVFLGERPLAGQW